MVYGFKSHENLFSLAALVFTYNYKLIHSLMKDNWTPTLQRFKSYWMHRHCDFLSPLAHQQTHDEDSLMNTKCVQNVTTLLHKMLGLLELCSLQTILAFIKYAHTWLSLDVNVNSAFLQHIYLLLVEGKVHRSCRS